MFRIEPADPDRLRTIGAPDDGCVAKKETAPRNDNGNQCQLCPQRVLQKPAEIVAHYVLRHQLPYCHICSMVFNSEVARMTHENLQHWPYKCVKCRSQFLHTAQRQQHMRNVHAIIECDLCPKTAESRPKYDDHLRRMHRCQLRTHDDASDAFRTAIAAPVLPTNDDGLQPIRQYLCHMCCRVHSVVHMLSHFLRYHAVGLNQLLAMLLRFQQNANEQVLSRFGACAPQKPPSGPLDALSFVDVAGNFELRELDHNNGHELTTAVSRVATTDFDTQLVKYVAASDDDGDDEDDKDVVVDNASIVCRTTERRYRCPYCEKGTEFNRTTLGRHMSGVHGFQLQNMEYRCQHCLRYFVQLQSLRQHYMREHGVDDASPSCPLCQQSVGTKKELRQHIRQHVDYHDHPQPPVSLAFCCRFCVARFWTVDQKNAHQNAQHALLMSNEDTLMCGHCGITTSSQSYLVVHTAEAHATLTQLGAFVFKCTICTIAYNSVDAVREHMDQVHGAEAQTEFCPVANCRVRLSTLVERLAAFAGLTTEAVLKRHLAEHHDELYAYYCRLCERTFSKKHIALKHFKTKHCPEIKIEIKLEPSDEH